MSSIIGHGVVCNNKIESIGVFPEEVQGVSATRGFNDLIAKPENVPIPLQMILFCRCPPPGSFVPGCAGSLLWR